ncbi:MAG: tRNA (adenosine(37)-N6)-threonylcarbamoyltransferase complex ATPase subunit type 1 TsaE [Lachnospiraceae bacterium]|nr:tRNA (adenosine(37)-N6)-threonylcarbamoyltransferase complex ATPase subunit type 1 TsaE [Lachnospiraceae bacterium]
MIVKSASVEETQNLAKEIAKKVKPGTVISLIGDLGAGKTLFTAAFAEALGISEDVSSPTFTIRKDYEDGVMPLYHFDAYRIGDPDEMEEIGYEDCFYGEGVSIVEWANLIEDIMPDDAVVIRIDRDPDNYMGRIIDIEGI